MLVFRYFVVVGAALLGCFWALDAFNGPAAPRAQQEMSSLQAWRAAEARKEATKDGRELANAVVMPDIATLPPTAERLAYERQLASNAVAAPVAASAAQSADATIANARAEVTEAAPQQVKRVATAKPKVKRKPVVIVASPSPQRPEYAGGFFGNIFSN